MAKKTEDERNAERDELARALGSYAINWSMVAQVELFTALKVLGLTGHAAKAFARFVRDQRLDDFLLAAAPDVADGDSQDALVAWVKRIRDARRERAELFHSGHAYVYDGDDWVPSLIKFDVNKDTARPGVVDRPIAVNEVKQANAAVHAILGDYSRLPAALRADRVAG